MIEQDDEELSRIYRDAEGPRPAQRVDDNVLAASQRVAGARPRPAGVRFARRWGAPVALAATVLVTSTLALMVYERQSGLETMAPAARRADRPAKVPAEPTRADPRGTQSPEKLQPIAPALPLSQSAARSDPIEQRPGGSTASSAPLGKGQPAFVPEVPRTSEGLRQREEATPPGAGQPAPLQDVPRAETQQRIRAMQAPRTAAPPAASPRPDAGPGVQSGISGAADIRSTELSANAEAKERTPEKWLEDIRKLKTEGKAAEVERELAEFKKRYPDYIVPEDLR